MSDVHFLPLADATIVKDCHFGGFQAEHPRFADAAHMRVAKNNSERVMYPKTHIQRLAAKMMTVLSPQTVLECPDSPFNGRQTIPHIL